MRKDADFPSLNTKTADGLKPGGKPYRVMVVETKEFQRKQIIQILESEEYKVVATAANGEEALSKLHRLEYKVDLITTCLDMPKMDGYAMLFEIKEKAQKPKIIFISEETTKGVMKDLITMGISDFIIKPIIRKTILDRVKNALRKEQ